MFFSSSFKHDIFLIILILKKNSSIFVSTYSCTCSPELAQWMLTFSLFLSYSLSSILHFVHFLSLLLASSTKKRKSSTPKSMCTCKGTVTLKGSYVIDLIYFLYSLWKCKINFINGSLKLYFDYQLAYLTILPCFNY